MRSLQKALQEDSAGRRVTDPVDGPLFADVMEDGDLESGTIYVLRSKSNLPLVAKSREVLHKIGVTGGDLNRRFASAKLDPTFLMADVEVVATYKLANINRTNLENIIHRVFDAARLDITIKDRLGNPDRALAPTMLRLTRWVAPFMGNNHGSTMEHSGGTHVRVQLVANH